jgi:hypothetical protein
MGALVASPLFGGAVEMAIPQRMVDISDFRQIPDNQEVRKSRRCKLFLQLYK